ncbi:hypothetical protein Q8723_14455, partial [Streptomyces cacaoi]
MTDKSSSTSTALATSLIGGYLLGRGGRTKAALGMAAYLASKKLYSRSRRHEQQEQHEDDGHGRHGKHGGPSRDGKSGSALGRLSRQVRGELLSAGRAAVSASVNRKVDAFADSLMARTRELERPEEQADEGEEPEAEPDRGKRAGRGRDGRERDEEPEERRRSEEPDEQEPDEDRGRG